MPTGRVGIDRGGLWTVDPVTDAAEVARFWSKVVRGPGQMDCWLWTGAIADDGYGRLQIRREGQTRVVRPNRYAVALAYGLLLDEFEVAEHTVCDVPICARVQASTGDHVHPSTQAENLARMVWKGRGAGPAWSRRFRGVSRAQRAAASRALRTAVANGWDATAIAAAMGGSGQEQLPF